MKTKLFFYGLLTLATMQQANAQSELYPKHFDLGFEYPDAVAV